jgi:DNA-binding transcriptional ArsR family regulator
MTKARMHPPADLERFARAAKALGDASRLRMVALLAVRPRYGEELAEILDLAPATVSHHLQRLRAADLVEARKEPPYVRWRLMPGVLADLAHDLLHPGAWIDGLDLPGEEQMAARALAEVRTPGGRLRGLPAPRRKRLTVLRWVLEHFERGRIYPELEVRRILMDLAHEPEEILKALLEEGWMRRQGAVLRRAGEAEEA